MIQKTSGINVQKYSTNNKTLKPANIALLTNDKFLLNSGLTFTSNNKENKIITRAISLTEKLKSKFEGNVIVISGPSGVGKDTIINNLLKKHPTVKRAISYTTREPRSHEVPGKDMNFITKEEFKKLIDEDKFLQHTEYKGNFYGTLNADLDINRKGTDAVLNITADHAPRIKEKFGKKALLIFIDPPNNKELEKRLRDRGSETEESIKVRMSKAPKEYKYADQFDIRITNETNKIDDAANIAFKQINAKRSFIIRILNKLQSLLEGLKDKN